MFSRIKLHNVIISERVGIDLWRLVATNASGNIFEYFWPTQQVNHQSVKICSLISKKKKTFISIHSTALVSQQWNALNILVSYQVLRTLRLMISRSSCLSFIIILVCIVPLEQQRTRWKYLRRFDDETLVEFSSLMDIEYLRYLRENNWNCNCV